jgi:hypothetical protein
MCIHRTSAPLFLLAFLLMMASCVLDTHPEYDFTVEAHHLEVLWCPDEDQLHWTFDFGLAPDEELDEDTPRWPGGSSYFLLGEEGGAGGGKGGPWCGYPNDPHMYSCASGDRNAQRWRIGETIDGGFLPYEVEVKINGLLTGRRPHPYKPNAPILQARFELGQPEEPEMGACVFVPVVSITQMDEPAETGAD